jgi:hypothetical protein
MPDARTSETHFAGAAADPCCEPALSLVNPLTGLANDYLNVYNEILLLLEFLPSMPEMTDDALAWQPRGYCEYFEQSSIPGARAALQAYDRVDPAVRARFEAILARLTEIALRAQRTLAAESGRPDYPGSIAKSCAETADAMRAGLAYVSRLINEGAAARSIDADQFRLSGC